MHWFSRQVQQHRLLLWTFHDQRGQGRPLEDHGRRRWVLWIVLRGDRGLLGYVRWTILNRLQSLQFDRVWLPNRGNVPPQSPGFRIVMTKWTYGSGNDDERVNLKIGE